MVSMRASLGVRVPAGAKGGGQARQVAECLVTPFGEGGGAPPPVAQGCQPVPQTQVAAMLAA
jgi:hypothetical protein